MTVTSNATPRDRLRIAIQKSGRLGDPARAMLASCGLTWRESRDRLFCYGETLPIDLLLVRDDDIPGLIADGVCDLGVVGRNVLLEAVPYREIHDRTGVSVTTIGRVARTIERGAGGYAAAIKRRAARAV